MSQLKQEDMQKLEVIDELIDDLELEIQKGLSMVNLGISPIEAFLNVFNLFNNIKNVADSIDDSVVKNVAQGKLKVAILDFEPKLSQALV